MTNQKQLDHIVDLVGNEPPAATPITPDVRSGATFPFFKTGDLEDPFAPFLVIWIFTVNPTNRRAFADAVSDFEASISPPIVIDGRLGYRGTYSVSVSSAAPEFEYRSIWTLGSLADLQALNEQIADTSNNKFQAMIKLIDLDMPMRTEIMGRTEFTVVRSR